MVVQGKKEGAGTALTDAEKQDVGGALAATIAEAMAQGPDFTSYSRDLGSLLWFWKTYGATGAMEAFLREQFDGDPKQVLSFVKRFMGKAIALETGLSQAAEFDRDSFDSLASIVEPAVVFDALRGIYGSKLDAITFEKCYELEGDEKVAGYFAALFKKVQEQRAQKENP